MSKEVSIIEQTITPSEKAIIRALTSGDVSIEVVVPSDMDPKELHKSINAACKVYVHASHRKAQMFPVIGKLLVVVQGNSQAMADLGFEGFDAYIDHIEKEFMISRSTAYEAMALAKRWGALPSTEFPAIGRRKFKLLNRVVDEGSEGKAKAKDLLAKAKVMTEEQLADYCTDKGYISTPGEVKGAVIKIKTSKATLKMWLAFIEDPRIQAIAGGRPDAILKSMMEEVKVEWLARAEANDQQPQALPEPEREVVELVAAEA